MRTLEELITMGREISPRPVPMAAWRLPVYGLVAVFILFTTAAAPSWAADTVPTYTVVQAEETGYDDVKDPIEPVNRFIFGFNELVQAWVLRPATEIYRIFIPPPIREVVGNMIDNVRSPVILANDLLQGETDRAWETTQRFAINTTIGVGGMFDWATDFGIPKHNEDFGQTLAVWGVGEGFYLVLPVFGPSNPRDAVGKVVDRFFDPLGLYLASENLEAAQYGRLSTEAVDEYGGVVDELDEIKRTSVDYYAALRSLYRQRRASEIRNGEELELPPIPDLDLNVQQRIEEDMVLYAPVDANFRYAWNDWYSQEEDQLTEVPSDGLNLDFALDEPDPEQGLFHTRLYRQ